jgi:threonine dehydratase
MANSSRKPAPKKAPSGRKPALAGYLQKILTARVYDVAIESALDPAPRLSARLGNRVLFRARTRSRCSASAARRLQQDGAPLDGGAGAGVICASAGNHAQGVALAARARLQALVVMLTTTPSLKVAAVRALGAEVVLRATAT